MIFKKVKCTAFLKKVSDGKFMAIRKDEIEYVEFLNSNDETFSQMSECCGDHEFLKTYYEIKDKIFSGILVGYKDIALSAWLCADTRYDFMSRESLRIYKESNEVRKCAIVYYGNNLRHYVPVECVLDAEG